MKCIIVEDQPPAQRILQKYIEDYGALDLIGTFSDAVLALEFLRSEQVELMFLDIHLPKISGIEFLKTLPHPPKVILTTAYTEYALEGYDLNVVDYLLKPFSFERFLKAVAKLPTSPAGIRKDTVNTPQRFSRSEIFIKAGYEHLKIDIDKILYIRSDADYTEIITQERKILSQETLRYWEEYLKSLNFVRTHKSYLVNISKIEKLIGNQVYLTSPFKVPVGRAYKEEFIKRLKTN